MTLSIGQRFTWLRTFTVEDVRQFSELSGDRGVHHVQPDTGGRVMVQGLLTATLPTKIGGDLNFIAREMTFEFLRPVFAGEAITTDVTFTKVDEQEGRLWASVEAVGTACPMASAVPDAILELTGLLPPAGPTWYVVLWGVLGLVQSAIALVMLAEYRRSGVWGIR